MSRAAVLASEINKTLGTNVLLGNDPSFQINRVPTGSLILDRITGGGFALGRHVELFGSESACKSYIAYRAMALSQQRGNLCALICPEPTYDSRWFEHLGGEPRELLTFHPRNAEDGIAVMMLLADKSQEHEVEIITLDSVSSFIPTEEIDNDPRKEDRIAGQARMMSRALRRLTAVNRDTLFIWINQLRTNVGVRFGNPNVTSGGKALRYYATTRIELQRATKVLAKKKVAKQAKLVETDVPVGRWIQCRVEKDKSTRPYREGSFVFDADAAEISLPYEILQLGLEDGIIQRTSNTFHYTDLDDREWKGTEKQFIRLLAGDITLQSELIDVIEDETRRKSEIGGDSG